MDVCLDSHSQACRLELLLPGPRLPRALQAAHLCNPASLPCLSCPSEARQLLVRVLPLAVSPLLYHGLHAGGGNLPSRSWRPMGVPSVGSLGVGINPLHSIRLLPGPYSLFHLYPKHTFQENAAPSEPSPSGVSRPATLKAAQPVA